MKRRKSNPSRKGKSALPAATVSLAPTQWDQGAAGPANRHGLKSEQAGDVNMETGEIINPNSVTRMRRVDMLEVWHRKGVITTAGYTAAEKLRDAFEGTQRSPGMAQSERVQSSPKPDHAVTIQIDRMSKFVEQSKHIAEGDREIIHACVLDRGSPMRIKKYRGGRGLMEGLEHLRDALERMAKAMGS